jgi:hypothetical protein
LFVMTGSAVIGIYVVAPLMASLRPLVGSPLLALALALAIVIGFAARVVSILRRTAPFVADSSGLLEMPLLSPAFPPHYEAIEERRLVIPSQRRPEALVESTAVSRPSSDTAAVVRGRVRAHRPPAELAPARPRGAGGSNGRRRGSAHRRGFSLAGRVRG